MLGAPAATARAESTLAEGSRCHGVDDGTLCIPLPRGWFGSVGFGIVERRSAAWLLAGNFPFSAEAATHEGTPAAPARKVLISVGDFPVTRWSIHPRRVRRLSLPAMPASKRSIKWNVRFKGRLLFLSVHFGAQPTRETRALVQARLDSIRRLRWKSQSR
jgi:hypothetical protein